MHAIYIRYSTTLLSCCVVQRVRVRVHVATYSLPPHQTNHTLLQNMEIPGQIPLNHYRKASPPLVTYSIPITQSTACCYPNR